MKRLAQIQRFLITAALVLCTMVLGYLAVSHLFETSHLYAGHVPEGVSLRGDNLLLTLPATAVLIAMLLVVYHLCEKKRSK